MENKIMVFDFQQHTVRTFIGDDGEPRWVGKDVCLALGIKNYRDTFGRLDDDEKDVVQIHTPGGAQPMVVVNEVGLYELIFRSDKPEAKAFRKWIKTEVLPELRRTGHYAAPICIDAPDPQTTLTVTKDALLIEGVRRLDRADAQIDDLRALIAAQSALLAIYRDQANAADAARKQDDRDDDPRDRSVDGRDYEKIVRLRAAGCSLSSIAKQMGRKLAVIEAALAYHSQQLRGRT